MGIESYKISREAEKVCGLQDVMKWGVIRDDLQAGDLAKCSAHDFVDCAVASSGTAHQ